MKTAVLDIGGSFIKYGQMDEELAITERGKVRTPEADRDAPPEEGSCISGCTGRRLGEDRKRRGWSCDQYAGGH